MGKDLLKKGRSPFYNETDEKNDNFTFTLLRKIREVRCKI